MTEAKGIHEHNWMKLGKKPPIPGRAAIPFSSGLTEATSTQILEHPIRDMDASGFSYPMDLNDEVGDCVVAGWDHFRQIVKLLLQGVSTNFSIPTIVDFYKTQNPDFDLYGTAETNGPGSDADGGMYIQVFLEYLQKNGYILGFAKINHENEEELKAAIYLGLGIIVGVDLEKAQSSQKVWDSVSSPEWGGHCVVLMDYQGSPDYIRHVSWGSVLDMTRRFILDQMDEAWFVIMQEHIDNPTFREHYDLQSFAQAFESLTGRVFPADVTPTPTPPVPSPEPGDASFRFTHPEVAARALEFATANGMSVDQWVTELVALSCDRTSIENGILILTSRPGDGGN
jgi:hypothetical protein